MNNEASQKLQKAGGAEREARALAQRIEDRAIQRARPAEGEVSTGDEPFECVLCGAESETPEIKQHNVTCPVLELATFAARCANEALDKLTQEFQELAERTYAPGAPGYIEFEKGLRTAYLIAAGSAQKMKGKE